MEVINTYASLFSSRIPKPKYAVIPIQSGKENPQMISNISLLIDQPLKQINYWHPHPYF